MHLCGAMLCRCLLPVQPALLCDTVPYHRKIGHDNRGSVSVGSAGLDLPLADLCICGEGYYVNTVAVDVGGTVYKMASLRRLRNAARPYLSAEEERSLSRVRLEILYFLLVKSNTVAGGATKLFLIISWHHASSVDFPLRPR